MESMLPEEAIERGLADLCAACGTYELPHEFASVVRERHLWRVIGERNGEAVVAFYDVRPLFVAQLPVSRETLAEARITYGGSFLDAVRNACECEQAHLPGDCVLCGQGDPPPKEE